MSQPEGIRKLGYLQQASITASVSSRTFSGVPLQKADTGSTLPMVRMSGGICASISSIRTALPK